MAEQIMQETAGKAIPAGYKQTEVGVIPEDWSVKNVSDVANIFSGGTPNRKIPGYWGGDIPWVTTTLIDGADILEANEFITLAGMKCSSVKWCEPGTILMAMYGQGKTRGKVASLSFGSTINQACAAIELKDPDSRCFVLHMLNYMYDYIRELSNSGGQENLSGSIIKNIKIAYPSKQEQTAIANVLSDSDALIDALEQLIAKKQAIKSATMQQLLTGRTRLPAFALRPDGTPKGYKPSELGDIPEDWEIDTIGGCASLITKGTTPMTIGRPFVEHGISFVKVESIDENGTFDKSKFAFIDNETNELLSRSKIKENDLLFSIAGALGRAAIASADILPANTNQALAIIRLKCEAEVNLSFLFYLTKLSYLKKKIEAISSQGAQPNLSLGDLARFPILLPSKKEQTAIATILSDMDNELQALTQKLEKARALKQGMMQQLLTGKIRLPLAAGA